MFHLSASCSRLLAVRIYLPFCVPDHVDSIVESFSLNCSYFWLKSSNWVMLFTFLLSCFSISYFHVLCFRRQRIQLEYFAAVTVAAVASKEFWRKLCIITTQLYPLYGCYVLWIQFNVVDLMEIETGFSTVICLEEKIKRESEKKVAATKKCGKWNVKKNA